MPDLAQDVICAVRDGKPVPPVSHRAFVHGVARGEIPAYQATAFLMAVYLRGLSASDTSVLTLAMRDSGETLDWSHLPAPRIDKHSTGGVGDKVSLALAPWVAACGAVVPMVAGRGLGQTGGTLDKLESIPGFRVGLDNRAFLHLVGQCGVAIVGQSERMAPADRTLYALRDVTGTVESIPLIVSSILSKKLSAGIGALVLDVKVGRGAFMKDEAAARALALALIATGREAGLPVRAVLTRMDAPLGRAIGNALEVREAIDILRGDGPEDTTALTLALGAEMLVIGGLADSLEAAQRQMKAARDSGKAWEKFRQMIVGQGGSVHAVEDPSLLPKARSITPLLAPEEGFVSELDAFVLGRAAMDLGAGRARAEDAIDPSVGLVLQKKVGEPLAKHEPWALVHHQQPLSSQWLMQVQYSLKIQSDAPAARPLMIDTLA